MNLLTAGVLGGVLTFTASARASPAKGGYVSQSIATGPVPMPVLAKHNAVELELKLREVNNYIERYETHFQQLFGKMYTQGVLLLNSDDVEELLPILLNALAPISEDGVATSLIKADLADSQRDLGEGHQDKIKAYRGRVRQLTTEIEEAAKDGIKPVEMFRAIMHFADHVLALIKLGLTPAKALRQRLIDELRAREMTKAEKDLPANRVKSKPLKAPSKEAFEAYRAYTILGMKQKEIAKTLKTKQYQISRYVTQVSAWIAAGHVLPKLDFAKTATKAVSVDPDIIDMGKRQDGRTKRHRRKADEDDD